MNYKKIALIVIGKLIATTAFCQSTDKNHVCTRTPNDATTTSVQIDNLPLASKSVDISYFDGLGRPLQNVSQMASPSNKDLIQPISYDNLGREKFKYLPFSSTSTIEAI